MWDGEYFRTIVRIIMCRISDMDPAPRRRLMLAMQPILALVMVEAVRVIVVKRMMIAILSMYVLLTINVYRVNILVEMYAIRHISVRAMVKVVSAIAASLMMIVEIAVKAITNVMQRLGRHPRVMIHTMALVIVRAVMGIVAKPWKIATVIIFVSLAMCVKKVNVLAVVTEARLHALAATQEAAMAKVLMVLAVHQVMIVKTLVAVVGVAVRVHYQHLHHLRAFLAMQEKAMAKARHVHVARVAMIASIRAIRMAHVARLGHHVIYRQKPPRLQPLQRQHRHHVSPVITAKVVDKVQRAHVAQATMIASIRVIQMVHAAFLGHHVIYHQKPPRLQPLQRQHRHHVSPVITEKVMGKVRRAHVAQATMIASIRAIQMVHVAFLDRHAIYRQQQRRPQRQQRHQCQCRHP